MLSSWQEPTKTSPSARAAKAATSMLTAGSLSRGLSSSPTSSRLLPAYARPKPKMAPILVVGFSCQMCQGQGPGLGGSVHPASSAEMAPGLVIGFPYKRCKVQGRGFEL